MVRVAFGGISHETNTFATRALGLTQRSAFCPVVGDGKMY
jgi:microcystin degradation protein MlrC